MLVSYLLSTTPVMAYDAMNSEKFADNFILLSENNRSGYLQDSPYLARREGAGEGRRHPAERIPSAAELHQKSMATRAAAPVAETTMAAAVEPVHTTPDVVAPAPKKVVARKPAHRQLALNDAVPSAEAKALEAALIEEIKQRAAQEEPVKPLVAPVAPPSPPPAPRAESLKLGQDTPASEVQKNFLKPLVAPSPAAPAAIVGSPSEQARGAEHVGHSLGSGGEDSPMPAGQKNHLSSEEKARQMLFQATPEPTRNPPVAEPEQHKDTSRTSKIGLQFEQGEARSGGIGGLPPSHEVQKVYAPKQPFFTPEPKPVRVSAKQAPTPKPHHSPVMIPQVNPVAAMVNPAAATGMQAPKTKEEAAKQIEAKLREALKNKMVQEQPAAKPAAPKPIAKPVKPQAKPAPKPAPKPVAKPKPVAAIKPQEPEAAAEPLLEMPKTEPLPMPVPEAAPTPTPVDAEKPAEPVAVPVPAPIPEPAAEPIPAPAPVPAPVKPTLGEDLPTEMQNPQGGEISTKDKVLNKISAAISALRQTVMPEDEALPAPAPTPSSAPMPAPQEVTMPTDPQPAVQTPEVVVTPEPTPEPESLPMPEIEPQPVVAPAAEEPGERPALKIHALPPKPKEDEKSEVPSPVQHLVNQLKQQAKERTKKEKHSSLDPEETAEQTVPTTVGNLAAQWSEDEQVSVTPVSSTFEEPQTEAEASGMLEDLARKLMTEPQPKEAPVSPAEASLLRHMSGETEAEEAAPTAAPTGKKEAAVTPLQRSPEMRVIPVDIKPGDKPFSKWETPVTGHVQLVNVEEDVGIAPIAVKKVTKMIGGGTAVADAPKPQMVEAQLPVSVPVYPDAPTQVITENKPQGKVVIKTPAPQIVPIKEPLPSRNPEPLTARREDLDLTEQGEARSVGFGEASPTREAQEVYQPRLSRETKSLLAGLPGGAGTPKPQKVMPPLDVQHNNAPDMEVAEGNVDIHEARGIQLQVKRPDFNVNRYLEDAYHALMKEELGTAMDRYQAVLDAEPQNNEAKFGLATTYHRMGELAMARNLYAEILATEPGHLEALNNLLVLVSQESPEEALDELKKLEAKNPDFGPIPAQIAGLYAQEHDFENAIASIQRAIEIDPQNLAYRYNGAVLMDRAGRRQEAIDLYSSLKRSHERGLKVPADMAAIQERLTFLLSNRG